MKNFRFHGGNAWTVAHESGMAERDGEVVLVESSKAIRCTVDDATTHSEVQAVLLFTNLEWAENYAADCASGFKAASLVDGEGVLQFLMDQQKAGTSLVLTNLHAGSAATIATRIEEVIKNVRDSLGED